jgi:hypothetical protein
MIDLILAIKTKRGHIHLCGYAQLFHSINIPRNGGRVKEQENRYITDGKQTDKSQIEFFDYNTN